MTKYRQHHLPPAGINSCICEQAEDQMIIFLTHTASAAPAGKSSAAVSFASGAVAGAAATVASYPFDLLRTTLAAQGEPKVRGTL